MIRCSALALGAALLLPVAAWAQPSFYCTAATTSVERAICGSNALSALDREMNQAYLRVSGRPGVAEAQRAWLTHRDRQCGPASTKQEGCLASLYAERLAELRAFAPR